MTTTSAPPSPYKGLAPFEDSELDALFFFGRGREIEIIVANLLAARLTILYGVSGVGKTSLLRAGVAHRLRDVHDAVVVVMSSWTGDPVEELLDAVEAAAPEGVEPVRRRGSLADVLAAWTRRLDADLYIVLDQFEEYFLYHEDEHGQGTLADELPEALRRGGLRANFLLGIREDSLAQLDAFKPRIPNLFTNSLRLDRLDRASARAAIEGPLDRYNELSSGEAKVSAEPALVDALLEQVAVGRVDLGQSGRGGVEAEDDSRIEAPYLQLVLERLWDIERAQGSNRLRLTTLDRLGGAAHIVEDHLERAMSELSPEEKDAAAAIYNHLVTPSGTKIAHRARDLAGYAAVDEAETEQVLQRLVEERIVRAGEDGAAGPRYEIFHDVLADAVLAWRTRHEGERRLEEERRAAARRHRRLVGVAVVALVVVAILAGIALYALLQRRDARTAARHARARELVALADSELPVDPERSVSLALRAAEQEHSNIVEDALRKTLAALRIKAVLPGDGPVEKVAFDPRGRFVLAAGKGGARLFDARTGTFVRTVDSASVEAGAFSPDGRLLVTGGDDGAVHVWKTQPLRLIHVLRPGGAVTSAAFSPRGGLLATTGADGRTRVWRVGSWRPVAALRQPGAVQTASFSADGRLLVTAGADRVARILDVRTGRLVRRLVQASRVTVARFAPSGSLVATAAPDRIVRLWDARTGKLRRALYGHHGQVFDVEFSPDSRRIVSASADESARVWDVRTGKIVSILLQHENLVVRAVFSPDGEYVATASLDGAARLFQADTGALRVSFLGHRNSLTDMAFGPRGRTLATASNDGTARLWDARPRRELTPLGRNPGISSLAFSSDDRVVLSAGSAGVLLSPSKGGGQARRVRLRPQATAISADGRFAAASGRDEIWVWIIDGNSARGRMSRVIRGAGRVSSLSFSADGRELVATDGDRTATVWRVDDGTRVHTIHGGSGTVLTASLSPDRRRLVTTGSGKTAAIWNLDTGKLEHSLTAHTARLTSAQFSRDGRFVVTTSRDHDARIWGARTGKPIWLLRGLADYAVVNGADFSNDGRWVVTAGPGSAGIWNVRTGRLLFFMHASEPLLSRAAFSHHGWRIATGGAITGGIETYDCRLCGGIDDLIGIARERLAALRR